MASGIFVGLSTLDSIHYVDEFPAANAKVVASGQAFLAGGPATNAAITFSHLGGRVTLVSAVGRHALGELLKDELARYKVEHIDLVPEWEESPTISSVWVNRDGERSVVSMNATNIDIPHPESDFSELKESAILMVDGHSLSASVPFALAARSRGIPVVLDGGSWKPGMEELLQSVDIAICSGDFRPPGCTQEISMISYLRALGIHRIAITYGAESIRMLDGSVTQQIDVPRVVAVDTTGAGDILHGAFCFFTAVGHSFEDALRGAAKIAAESCRFHGTREWMQVETEAQSPS